MFFKPNNKFAVSVPLVKISAGLPIVYRRNLECQLAAFFGAETDQTVPCHDRVHVEGLGDKMDGGGSLRLWQNEASQRSSLLKAWLQAVEDERLREDQGGHRHIGLQLPPAAVIPGAGAGVFVPTEDFCGGHVGVLPKEGEIQELPGTLLGFSPSKQLPTLNGEGAESSLSDAKRSCGRNQRPSPSAPRSLRLRGSMPSIPGSAKNSTTSTLNSSLPSARQRKS